MTEQKPSIGRIVQYTLSEGDVALINANIPQSDHPGHIRRNSVHAGETYPAIVVRVFNQYVSTANLQVFLDGAASYWATSRRYDAGGVSDTPGAPTERSYEGGTWHWPERV
jgi:hypothetical protein